MRTFLDKNNDRTDRKGDRHLHIRLLPPLASSKTNVASNCSGLKGPSPTVLEPLQDPSSNLRIRHHTKVAQKLLTEAVALKKDILEQAERQSAQICQGAYEAGYLDGKTAAINTLCHSALSESALLARTQQLLSEACKRICSNVLSPSSSLRSDGLEARLSQALETHTPQASISLRLHPDDASQLSTQMLSTLENHGLTLLLDTKINPGDFSLETPAGKIESDLSTHLESILLAIEQKPSLAFPSTSLQALPRQVLPRQALPGSRG